MNALTPDYTLLLNGQLFKLEAMKQEILAAKDRIAPWVKRTPLIRYDQLSRRLGIDLYLKCENFQTTGSFKLRGCLNAVLTYGNHHYITRSSGNFAGALSWTGAAHRVPVTIAMPKSAPRIKIDQAKEYGAEVFLCESRAEELEVVNQRSTQEQLHYLSPFDDSMIIAGQGTVITEILAEELDIAHFICPTGGGGLMAGCTAALEAFSPKTEIISAEPLGSNSLQQSINQNQRIELERINTIADGIRSPQIGVHNWSILQNGIDRALTVTDQEIISAMATLFNDLGIVSEPSGAISLAVAIKEWKTLNRGPAVCVISGGNVDRKQFLNWISSQLH